MPTCLRLADERVCSCKKAHDDVGYHVLNCSRNNKKIWPAITFTTDWPQHSLRPSHSWVHSPLHCHRTRTVGSTFLWRSEMKRHHRQRRRTEGVDNKQTVYTCPATQRRRRELYSTWSVAVRAHVIVVSSVRGQGRRARHGG